MTGKRRMFRPEHAALSSFLCYISMITGKIIGFLLVFLYR